MTTIGEVITSIFDRGMLPELIVCREACGPIAAGDVLTWSESERAYMHRTGRWVVWALTVRQGWGHRFDAAPSVFDRHQAIRSRADIVAA